VLASINVGSGVLRVSQTGSGRVQHCQGPKDLMSRCENELRSHFEVGAKGDFAVF
jgi:hypothetical protein